MKRQKRQYFTKQNIANDNTNEDTQSNHDHVSNASGDDQCKLPLQRRREMARKTDNVTLTLPAKSILKVVAATCTITKKSIRNKMKVVKTLLKAGYPD